MNFQGIKKILVIKLRHIGDVLLTVPVFRALRENFPQAHITVVVNSGTEDVLSGNTLINEIILFDRGIKKINRVQKYLKELYFLKKIREKGLDMAVDLTGGDRAAIISLASGAKYRLTNEIGKTGFIGKRYLYTHLAKNDSSRHMVLQNLNVVGQFGITTDNLNVDIFIPEDARTFIKNVFEKNNIRGKVIHVHPTSRWLFKCWKDEYMAEVISWLLDKGINVIMTSSPDKREMDKAKRILSLIPKSQSLSPNLTDLCGKTTIKQLAAISEASDLYFGVDSAPMHIAAAVNTHVVALFGPSGAFHWGPWDNNYRGQGSGVRGQERPQTEEIPYPKKNGIQTFGIHTVIQKNGKCIPCGKDGCNGSKISRCLEEITPDEVKTILTKKLREIEK